MNEISTLFTAIGNFFTGSDWFGAVKWPFWILLFTVAAGGVYCARFGKKTLLNLGISGTLNLIVIYLFSVIGYCLFPPLQAMFSQLPFLTITDHALALVNPFVMSIDRMAPLLLRLMLLVILINTADTFCGGGKSLLTWLLAQCVSIGVALLLYTIITAGISLIIPDLLGRFAIVPVVLLTAVGVLMLCAKFVFMVVLSGENAYFSAIYKFFTVNKGGSLFTVSALSYLLSQAVLIGMHVTGCTSLSNAWNNPTALWIILAMMLVVLYIFAMFYNDRKKA